MKGFKFLMALTIVAFTACSGSKKSSSNFAVKDVAGYYLGTEDFENWSCSLDEDGTGYEMAQYRTGSIQIAVPFTWAIQGDEITFTFDVEEASVEGDADSETAEAIVSSALAGYSEPRTCTLKSDGGNITIDGEGLYPTFQQMN